MKIVLIGASGNIGQRILKEALSKGYAVHAVQRNPANVTVTSPHLTVGKADILNETELEALIKNADVVVSAISPVGGLTPEQFKQANKNIAHVLAKYPSVRAVIVGGAGSTEVSPGLRLMDSPIMEKLPAEWKPAIYAHAEVLELYKHSKVNWTYFSPANFISAGERTGHFRLGSTNMIFDEKGESKISYEDYAVALINEIAEPKHVRQQFTIGY